MINRILMELYDDYENGKIESLIEFANKTFPQDGTEKLFIGCTLIMFSRSGAFKPRYSTTRENLYSIVFAAKESVRNINFLAYYVDRINTQKGISKYLSNVVNDPKIHEYANVILDYLDQFKPHFVEEIKETIDKTLLKKKW